MVPLGQHWQKYNIWLWDCREGVISRVTSGDVRWESSVWWHLKQFCLALHLSNALFPSVLRYFMRGRRVICGCYSLPHTSMEGWVKGDTRSRWAHPAGHPHTPALLWKKLGMDVDRQTDGGERGEERKRGSVGKLFLNETSHAYKDILHGLGRVWRLCLETSHQNLAIKVPTSHLLQ